MPGCDTHNSLIAPDNTCIDQFLKPCNRCGTCRLNTDPLKLCKVFLRRKEFLISHSFCRTVRFAYRDQCFACIDRITNTDRSCNRFRIFHRRYLVRPTFNGIHYRGCTFSLDPCHFRNAISDTKFHEFLETFVYCRNISCISNRQHNPVRNPDTKLVNNLKTNCLLSLKPVRIHGIQ